MIMLGGPRWAVGAQRQILLDTRIRGYYRFADQDQGESGGWTLSESVPVENGEFQETGQGGRNVPGSGGISGEGRKIFFETKSMAEVYAQQGHVSTALEIYRRIHRRHPEDRQVLDRMAELEARISSRKGVRPKSETPGQGESTT
jgi:hypothetical protein